jgi:hypothetical protein
MHRKVKHPISNAPRTQSLTSTSHDMKTTHLGKNKMMTGGIADETFGCSNRRISRERARYESIAGTRRINGYNNTSARRTKFTQLRARKSCRITSRRCIIPLPQTWRAPISSRCTLLTENGPDRQAGVHVVGLLSLSRPTVLTATKTRSLLQNPQVSSDLEGGVRGLLRGGAGGPGGVETDDTQ